MRFEAVGFGEDLNILRTREVEVELGVQLSVYEESKEVDEEQMIQSEEMMSLSHHQLFHTIFEKVRFFFVSINLIIKNVISSGCWNATIISSSLSASKPGSS